MEQKVGRGNIFYAVVHTDEKTPPFLVGLDDYDLLILDALSVERGTEYALEPMYSVVNSRYRCRNPLIATTNLKLDEIKNPPDLVHARLDDRVLERCAPILFARKNFRKDNVASAKKARENVALQKTTI